MNKIVAFDIGTRSVVGIVLEKIDSTYRIQDFVSVEHDERSMLDGQIHDILSVSKTITKVKDQLEQNHGPILKVCVAAAGRALKTEQTSVTKEISHHPLINHEDILHLELAAVQEAQKSLASKIENEDSTNYYCAGYSVLNYKLDGSEIGSLIDQQGDIAEVEIIATFLPKVVVESLISALHRSDLEMDALTLEPIAAINVLIPTSMRRLNVALVDIGAGTSDIAITNYGTVIGYGMVPIAGDEITEAISQHYLLDFPLAEKVKREVTTKGKGNIVDILGFESEVTYDDLAENINEAIEELAANICEAILQLNRKIPQAVMLVGGGSLTPNLTKKIAHILKLPENRVATRGTDAIQNLEKSNYLPDGPAFVTPIGIAIAAKQNPIHYVSVHVNDRIVRLFDLKELTIGDSLLAAGVQIKKLYGRPGMAYIVNVNGKDITIPGTLGNPPIILKNGETATLKDPISEGDKLFIEPGSDGEVPVLTVKDLLGSPTSQYLMYNNKEYNISQEIWINGIKKESNTLLQDGDQIILRTVEMVKDLLIKIGQADILNKVKPFTFRLNGKENTLKKNLCTITVNNREANVDTLIKDGDHIQTFSNGKVSVKEIVEQLEMELYDELTVHFNSKKIVMRKPIRTFYRNNTKLALDDVIYDGDALMSVDNESEAFIFQDLFRYIDIDVTQLKGKQFKLYINGNEASFISPLAPHDKVNIQWIESIFSKK